MLSVERPNERKTCCQGWIGMPRAWHVQNSRSSRDEFQEAIQSLGAGLLKFTSADIGKKRTLTWGRVRCRGQSAPCASFVQLHSRIGTPFSFDTRMSPVRFSIETERPERRRHTGSHLENNRHGTVFCVLSNFFDLANLCGFLFERLRGHSVDDAVKFALKISQDTLKFLGGFLS